MILDKLYPLGVRLAFEDRPYRLGDTIRVTVELTARREVEVREARVDLVCEEDYVMSYTVMSPGRPSSGQGRAPGEVFINPPMTPNRVKKEQRESYVHSSVVILSNASVAQGAMQYTASLEIDAERPPHVSVAKVSWRLEGVADVVMARDVRARYDINVEVG